MASARRVSAQTDLFHGTRYQGDLDRLEPRGGAVGIHAGSEEQARYMSGDDGRVLPVNMTVNNPLRTNDMENGWEDIENYLPILQWEGKITPEQAKTISDDHARAFFQWQEDNPGGSHEALMEHNAQGIRALIQSHGYDGLVYNNDWEGEGDSYVAFHPDQVQIAR